MSILEAVILAVVEGLTEYLPVSSTGHIILGTAILGIEPNAFTKTFTVAVQFGAILAVLVLYGKRFFQSFEFYLKLLIAFIPAAVLGLLLASAIDALLESVTTVAIMLIIGGVAFLFVDKWFKNSEQGDAAPTRKKALIIGLFQTLALVPGVSRSAATIIGGLTQNLTRKATAEFSFFLAVPTLFAASAYKLLKFYLENDVGLTSDQISVLVIGNVVAFFVALVAIKTFISFLTKHGFKVFGYYRILAGIVILLLNYFNKLSII